MAVTLSRGQYQIGNLRFGRNTNYPIESMEVTGYGVSSSDYQLPRADELQFAIDTLQPSSINFTIGIMGNFILPNMAPMTGVSSISNLQNASELLERLHFEWKADDIRGKFGFAKPLLYCRDGVTVRIYGRPRKFAHDTASLKSQFRKAVCEYQRIDTLCYTEQEFTVIATSSAEGTTTQNIVRSGGLAPTWVRMLLVGPANHPKIKLGNLPLIDINYNLAAGKVLEINSYPWERRVVNSDSLNVSPLLINNSPYLDELRIAPNATTGVGFNATNTNSDTKLIVAWREAYHSL